MFYSLYIAAFVVIFSIFFGIQSSVYIFGPIILLWIFYKVWVRYIKLNYVLNKGYTLLELIPSEDLTGRSIELFLSTLNSPIEDISFFEKYWKGKVVDHISIEVVSDNKGIHFYIRTYDMEDIKNRLRSFSLNSKLVEVDDYSRNLSGKGIGVEFSESAPLNHLKDVLKKGDTTWSQFTLKSRNDGCFDCGIRVIYFPNEAKSSYNKKLVSSYQDRDYFLNDNNGFKISPKELSQIFKI